MDAQPILVELEAFAAALAAGESVPTRATEALVKRVMSGLESLSKDEVLAIRDALDRLVVVAAARKDELGQALQRVGAGRRAMRGYGRSGGGQRQVRLYRRA